MEEGPALSAVPRWLHAWAVLTAVAALPLVLLGAEVTTKQVGMVDDVGFRPPWHLLTASLRERGLGYLIEHGHRLAGFVVGTMAIVLALGCLAAVRRGPARAGWVAAAVVATRSRATRNVSTGSAMFLTRCSPIGSNDTASLLRT